jgi:hypothetical protein
VHPLRQQGCLTLRLVRDVIFSETILAFPGFLTQTVDVGDLSGIINQQILEP